MMDFLSEFDYFFVYTLIRHVDYVYPDEEFTVDMTPYMDLNGYQILPVSDGKLDIHSYKDFCKEWNARYINNYYFSQKLFLDYVKDGLDESVFAEYIRENKEKQINRENEE